MKLHKDGSFSGLKQKISLRFFEQQGDTFVPKFPVCPHREGLCKVSPCGKFATFKWKCHHFDKPCDMIVCGDCDVPKSG